jgi:hypothetical protein
MDPYPAYHFDPDSDPTVQFDAGSGSVTLSSIVAANNFSLLWKDVDFPYLYPNKN